MSNTSNLASQAQREYRERISQEDTLLTSRTGVFLVPNGILVAALGFPDATEPLKILICCLGLLVTLVWLLCGYQSWRAIERLTKDYLGLDVPRTDVEEAIQEALTKPGKHLRPTNLLGYWLPGIFLVGWLVALVAHLRLWLAA